MKLYQSSGKKMDQLHQLLIEISLLEKKLQKAKLKYDNILELVSESEINELLTEVRNENI